MKTKPTIIGFCGYKQCGKNYIADHLSAQASLKAPVTSMAFADKLKEYAAKVLSGNHGEILDDVRKMGYSSAKQALLLHMLQDLMYDPRSRTKENGKHRWLLQILGTDVFRQWIDQEFWVKAVVKNFPEQGIVFLTDVRFPNEAEVCDYLFRVVGPLGVESSNDGHVSENPDAMPYHSKIDNSDHNTHPDTALQIALGHIFEVHG